MNGGILASLVSDLSRGHIKIVDLTQTLSPDVPSIVLPPEFGQAAPFRIEEVIDGATGKMVFVVTDGSGTSCDAPTRELAEATLDALEGKRCAVVRSSR